MAESNNQFLNENLYFLAGAFARQLGQQADEEFETVGLSSSHALLLLLIRNEPGIQPSGLAEKLYLKPSTITRLVQKLERRGLVEKQPEGRTTSIACTSDGEDMAAEIEGKWQKLISQKEEQLGERYVSVLSEMIANALETSSSE